MRFRAKALTLAVDRTGYTIAVKGLVTDLGAAGVLLDGRSAIVLAPPTALPRPAHAGSAALPLPEPPPRLHGLPQREQLARFLGWWAGFQNPQLHPWQCRQIGESLTTECEANHLDPLLLASLVQIESAYHVDALSRSGAIGLGQLMPFTARWLKVDAHDVRQNIKGSARMLAGLLRSWKRARWGEARTLAIASYNAGAGTVTWAHGVPPIPETTNYVYFIGYVRQQMSQAARRLGMAEPKSTDGLIDGPLTRSEQEPISPH